MKTQLIAILITLTIQIYSNNVVVKCHNIIKNTDTITLQIDVHGGPEDEMEFDRAMSKIASQIRFKNDTHDQIMFWIYIIKTKEKIESMAPKERLEVLVKKMNGWLKFTYGHIK